MAPATQSVINGVWLGQLALLAILATVLIVKEAWKSFPLFTTYSVFHLVTGLVQFALFKYPRVYLYTFVVIESLAIILGLGIAYEIFAHLFNSQGALRKLATYLLLTAIAALIVLALVVVRQHAPAGLRTIASAIVVTEEAARVLEVGLLAFLFVCSGTFGLHWRQPVFGIALGLALFSTVELIVVALRAQLSPHSVAVFSIVRMSAFAASLATWIIYLWVPERVPASQQLPQRAQLEQWNRAVMELIHQ